MDALEKLIAQQEIRDLSARYAMFLDDHESSLAAYWSPAGASTRSPIGIRFQAANRTLSHHCGNAGPLASLSLRCS